MKATMHLGTSIKRFGLAATWLLLMAVTVGCASSEVTERRSYAGGEQIPRPGRIIVYDFASTPQGVGAHSAISGRYELAQRPQSPQQIRLGQELGRRVAAALVKDILAMGLPAERANTGPPPNIGNLVITGEFVTIEEGSRGKRMIIGFGSGAGKLRTVVEKYQITAAGPRLLKSLGVSAAGGKGPGMAVPLIIVGGIFGRPVQAAVISGAINLLQQLAPEKIQGAANRTAKTISKELRTGFRRRGWI